MVRTRCKTKTACPNKTSESSEVAGKAESKGQASHFLMGARGKNKTDSPDKASEAYEVAENAEAENVEELNGDGQFEDKVEIPVEETGAECYEDMLAGEESVKVENDDGDLKMDTDNKAESDQHISEDDELDDQENQIWEDDEESSEEEDEESVPADDGVNDEDTMKEGDDVDEVSAEEEEDDDDDDDEDDEFSAEEEDDDKDAVNIDKATEVAKADEMKANDDDDEDDEFSAEEEDDGKDAVNIDKATEVAKADEMKANDDDDDEDDEFSAEEEDDGKDAVNIDKATEVAKADEMKANDDDDEDNEFSAEEKDDGKDADNIDKATEVAKADEMKAKAKAIEDGGKAKPTENGKEAKEKEDGREGKAKEDGKEAKDHDSSKVEVGSKNDKNSNNKIRKKKAKVVGPKKVDSRDKPESSQKTKGNKKVESMGMIFMCSSKTRDDCFQYKVLGLPESKKDMVQKIYSGMRLFLYDVDLKLMHGIFKAVGPGGYNIEPKAFKSQFPSQVRFAVLDDCLPLPEEKFKIVIKENYYSKNKFDCQLKAEQVKQLCKLFVTSSKGNLPKKSRGPRKGHKAENSNPLGPETSRRWRVGDKRHPALEEELRRPRKRSRKVITSPRRQPLPERKVMISPRRQPLPAPVPSYAYERTSNVDAYNRRDPYYYRDRRDLSPVTRRDPYRDVLDPSPVIRRDPYLERDYPYRDGRDLYVERRDPYRDGRDAYAKRHPDPYIDETPSYPDIGTHSSYRDGRAPYLERRDAYRDPAYSVPYSSAYRRDPPLSDARDIYRGDQGGEYRSSLRREELHPLNLETRYRPDIGSRDSYASTRQLPLYADPIYSAEYPSRAGLAREYRL